MQRQSEMRRPEVWRQADLPRGGSSEHVQPDYNISGQTKQMTLPNKDKGLLLLNFFIVVRDGAHSAA